MKVLKFGGTSVGSAAAIAQVARIVQQQRHIIVVCSAMSGITNQLLKMAGLAAARQSFSEELEQLALTHLSTIEQLLPATHRNPGIIAVKIAVNELEQLLQSISTLEELTERSKALLLSYGERLSCQIITDYFQYLGINSVYTDARLLLKTTGDYNQGKLDEKASATLVKNWYHNMGDAIPVFTGFIASNSVGHTTNLGRGGSDYTASILGAFLQAESVEIWTDVDGFYTADPRLVRKAFPLETISYAEALELSYFGAKVIYAPTLIPAINQKIPIWIKNTFRPEAHGTLIQEETSASAPLVKGISSITEISLINIIGNGMVGFKGFSARLFGALSHAQVNVILITQASSEHTITIAIAPADQQRALHAIRNAFEYEIQLQLIEPPVVEEQLSIVAVVGSNMRHASGVSGKLFSALGRSGINISAIAQGSSELNISVVIRRNDLKRAMNAIHDAMFLSDYKTIHLYVMGVGQIGKELLQQIAAANERLKAHRHVYLQLAGISNSRKMLLKEDGIPLEHWKVQLEEKGMPASLQDFIQTMAEHNLPNTIFIDNTANASVAGCYEQVFQHNASVVTCNKIACSADLSSYQKLKQLSARKGLSFYYETNVGAGLPVIQTLQDLVMSGDEVLKVEAVLSGTISYIFNQYHGDASFSAIVKKAQELGYTEPDPRDDLNGKDFARKALILAREMGLAIEMEKVNLQPLLPESCFNVSSVDAFYEEMRRCEPEIEALKQQAETRGEVLRYIAQITPNEVSISLQQVGPSHPFYHLSGSDNIISFTTRRYEKNPLVVKGPGAGVAVTAAGVFADIMKVSSV
ncbi:MAG: bifunctional aspartate kinase/homoserine dehydrogenase I [Chitinophagales bacterium]